MASNKVYWKSFDQLANTEVSQRLAENEFAQDIPVDVFLSEASSSDSTSLALLGALVTACFKSSGIAAYVSAA